MAGPYRGVNLVLRVKISGTWYTIGVVEGSDINFGYEGGPEAHFGSRTKVHSAGSKRISFTLTRWYYTATGTGPDAGRGQEDLLLDLFTGETEFSLEGYLIDKDGDQISKTSIKLTGCRLYTWKIRTGGAEDILGEEATGFATDWDFAGFAPTTP